MQAPVAGLPALFYSNLTAGGYFRRHWGLGCQIESCIRFAYHGRLSLESGQPASLAEEEIL
jgi:hypothetical protein